MRLARVEHDGAASWAVLEGDTLALIADPLADRGTARGGESVRRGDARTGVTLPLAGARLLAPAVPLNVVGMAHNTGPGDRRLPPQAFLKPARTVVGPGAEIVLPAAAGRVDAEAELAVVVGRPARHLTKTDALGHVLGFALANDVTARELQSSDPLWTSAKSLDASTPLGPCLDTSLDPADVPLTLTVNGMAAAPGSTAELARSVVEVLVYITSFMTLGPGDVVLTGAPGEVTRIRPGDHVAVDAPGLGRLGSTVSAERAPLPVPA